MQLGSIGSHLSLDHVVYMGGPFLSGCTVQYTRVDSARGGSTKAGTARLALIDESPTQPCVQ